jgi:hypothetical protein
MFVGVYRSLTLAFQMHAVVLYYVCKLSILGLSTIYWNLLVKFVYIQFHVINIFSFFPFVATLALGSQPRQGLARLRAKKKAQESHHMLMGVQRV